MVESILLPESPLLFYPTARVTVTAEDHIGNLTESKMYLDTLERYGTEMPDWMAEDTLMPEPREASPDDIRSILAATGIEYVAMASEEEPDTLEVIHAGEFLEGEDE